MKKQGVATLVVSHDPKRERNWCTESSAQQSTEFALALATMKALEISVSTRNVEEVAAVRLTCRFWTPRLVGIVAIIALTLASMLYVIRMYHPGNLSIVRVANLFATLIIALALSLAFRGLRVLRAAFTGNLRAKPFSRKDDEGLLHELFKTNGKYFLWKIYVGEVLEMLYQVANYTLYSCVMHDISLLLYNIVMVSGTAFHVYSLRSPNVPVGSQQKSNEVMADILLEIFSMAYPLCIMFVVNDVKIHERELLQILCFPLICMLFKLEQVWMEDIIVLYDNVRIEEALGRIDKEHRQKRRRTSYALREQNVVSLQNELFPEKSKRWTLVVFVVIMAFYIVMSIVQLMALARTPSAAMQKCCVAPVSTCGSWFQPKDNCMRILYTTTYRYTEDATALLKEATGWNAARMVSLSGVRDVSMLKGKWPDLSTLTLVNGNLSFFSQDVGEWSNIHTLEFFNMTNLVHVHPSVWTPPRSLFGLTIVKAPLLNVPDIRAPTLRRLVLNSVNLVAKTLHIPDIYVVALVNANISDLPDMGSLTKATTFLVPANRLSNLDNMPPTGFLNHLDIRWNYISINSLPIDLHQVRYKYAHGNTPECPESWICKPFCSRTCMDSYYLTYEKNCIYSCIEPSCEWSNKCKASFTKI